MQITRRQLIPEKMDDPAVDRDELGRALRFLRWVNRRLGGAGVVLRHLDQWFADWPGERPLRILDVATGSADIPLAIAAWAEKRNLPVEIVACDLHATTLDWARELVGERAGIQLLLADARRLMDHFEPGSFDCVHAGLFLHHLPDIEVLTVLRIMQRLSSHGVIWNDLIRSPITKLGVWPIAAIAPPIARHDAIVSMNAGFTKREALEFARRVGLEQVRYRRHLLHRFTLTSERR